ncbi:MAG: tRNA (adenosine(37)-N6)-threonylcarbamoyltransferase complex transferase subunit TsaD [Clostridiales bacterium]|nr:tRNA (adenosine(37)-N6)-threonylcarbamoyltransferase complex transferase subunit TsaD [Clostridiales bacterium]
MNYAEESRAQAAALREKERVRILAIESSCDETAAAVVENGRVILSNAVFSQIDMHALYGGVVPEIASRAHVEAVDRMVDEALRQAGETLSTVDALAVTYGPGLVGALLTGVTCAKALAFAARKPLVPVHHIEGHICANFLTDPSLEPPFTCLVVSGGHSHILEVRDYGVYRLLGCTQDDAAGEAFDKAARVLNLPYPGGPRLDRLAEEGEPHALKLPMPHMEGKYDFSFSGLKTAFINAVHHARQRGEAANDADMAASFRWAAVHMLVEKTMLAARDTHVTKLALAGGVSANSLLRREMQAACDRAGIRLYMPRLELCGDNAAMIGSAAYFRLMRGETATLSLNARPSLPLL